VRTRAETQSLHFPHLPHARRGRQYREGPSLSVSKTRPLAMHTLDSCEEGR